MAQGNAVMGREKFKANARTAWRTVTNGYRTAVTDANKDSLRDAWAVEMAELFGGKVTTDAVFQRLSALRKSGGLPPVPQGTKGRHVDTAAESAALQAEIAELQAAGFVVELDDNGNIASVTAKDSE